MNIEQCPWCSAEFHHRPLRSETLIWECGSWKNEGKGLLEQSTQCQIRELKRTNKQLRAAVAELDDKDAEIERLKRERNHFAYVAQRFATNEPGTPVPDWCELGWSKCQPMIDDECLAGSEAAHEEEWAAMDKAAEAEGGKG